MPSPIRSSHDMVLGMDEGGAKGPFRPTIEMNCHSSPSKAAGVLVV